MIQEGDIVKLDNNKEYIVVSRMQLHNINYIFFMTSSKPLEVLIATEKMKDGKIFFEEIKDNDELDYVLNTFALDNND